MVSLVAEKIFVDPSEEISFLIERILKSGKEHIIIVVPSSSILFASNLSIKILYRSTLKASKVAVIVTEDAYGAKISQKAGFVVVQKVSQITSDLWEVAKGKLFTAQNNQNRKKDELLKNIKGEDPTIIQNEIFESSDLTTEVYEIDVNKQEEEIVYNTKDTYIKPKEKIEEKIKEISGIKIYSGSDIEKVKKKHDKIDKLDKLDMTNVNEDMSAFSEKRFAGRDVTKLTPQRKGISKIFGAILPSGKTLRPEDRIDDVEPKKWYKRKSLIILLAVFFITLIIGYLTLFQFSTVSIRISLKSETVLAQETVEIDTQGKITSVDTEGLIIPGKLLETSEISISTTATATGEGKRGERATGAFYIFNKSREAIDIPAGTKIRSVMTGRIYETLEDVTLPQATQASDLSVNPSRTDNIRVRAVSFGEEYNIEDSFEDNGYGIEDFPSINALDVKREGPFIGGTTETFVMVGEEDLENVKKSVLENLEKQTLEELKADVPSGFNLIEETIKFEEVKVVSTPEVGKEAQTNPDGKFIFDVTLVGKATGVMIRENDLREIIQSVIVDTDNSGNDILNNLSDVKFRNFVENSKGIFITIYAEGEVVSEFNEEEIFDQIKGKKLNEAQVLLESIEEVQYIELKYYPSLIPESLNSYQEHLIE